MSELKAKCIFHGIGQGLMYSCDISRGQAHFRFMYDCGTLYKKDKDILVSEINKIARYNENTIDVLFLSHLDKDHISGVPYLLSKCEVKNVFIPYLSPEELMLLSLKNEITTESELFYIYSDPIQYFAEKGCQVFVIYPQNQNGRLNDNNYQDSENSSFFYEGNFNYSNGGKVVHCYGELKSHTFSYAWEFSVYQDQSETEQKKIIEEIKAVLPFEIKELKYEYNKIFNDKSLMKKIHDKYNSVKGGINQSSLVLYHAPASEEHCYNYCGGYCPWCIKICDLCCSTRTPATLLTGDIDLTALGNNRKRFLDFIADKCDRIGILQLPHHGSGVSISINMIKAIVNEHTKMVCSYGRGNKYYHPDAYMLDKLNKELKAYIWHVVSNQSHVYYISDE